MHNINSIQFTATWCKGSANAAPDALFRYPVSEPSQEHMLAEQDEEHNPAPSIAERRVHLSDDWSESEQLQDLWKYAK